MAIALDGPACTALLEALPTPIAHCRLVRKGGRAFDFTFIGVNAEYARLAGSQSLAGQRVSEAAPGLVGDIARVLETIEAVVVKGGLGQWEQPLAAPIAWRALAVSGAEDEFLLIASAHRFAGERGTPSRAIDELSELVERRTAELAVAKEAAESAARSKSAFLANMSHEVRTPLSAVLGIAQLALFRDLDQRSRADFNRILESGRHLLALLDDVLDLSKIEAAKLGLRNRAASPVRIVRDAVDLFAADAASRGIELSAEAAQDLPAAILCDSQRMQQVLLNLISNALKFTTAGQIAVRARRDGDILEIDVADTGIGIAANDLERIFDPFEQASETAAGGRTGSGLGLAISRRLAELMGGTLTVRSEAGIGSTFTLRLPLVTAEETRQNSPASGISSRGSLRGTRILVVDDHAVTRMVLQETLSAAGATVTTAADGAAAVDQVRSHGPAHFDLVLIDVRMPRMDGCEATRAIHGIDPDLPVVGQTAHAAREEHARCRTAGMLDVLSKPIHLAELVDRVPGWVARQPRGVVEPRTTTSIDWDGLRRLYGERSEILARLLRTAIESHVDLPSRLRRSAAAGDRQDIGAAAHFIRSGAAMIEAHGLGKLAAEVEAACTNDIGNLAPLANRLADAVAAMTADLRAHVLT